MKRRRHSRARALAFLVLTGLFCFALVFFPLRGRGSARAGATGAGSAAAKAEPAPSPAPKGKTKPAAPQTSASAASTSGAHAPAEHPHDAKASDLQKGADEKDGKAAKEKDKEETPTIPLGKGLPVFVNVGVYFLEVKSFEDSKGEFECTTDLRLSWDDSRLKFPEEEAYRGYKELRGKEAEAMLATMWTPNIEITNRPDNPIGYVGRRLRISPSGHVEFITRATARYKARIEAETFPFDRQQMPIELLMREQTTDEVILKFEKDDVAFSRLATDAKIEGWQPGLVDLRANVVAGWNGDRYSGISAALFVDRVPSTGIAPIFIPLVASLLIPLLAIWMNRATEDGFEIEAFELANMGIGGLFSVIALSFAIYTSYPILAGGDNTVVRLFGLNYASLAMSLGIVVLLFQYNLPLRWFGRHVHAEVFRYITWAMPVLSLGLSVAFLLLAAS